MVFASFILFLGFISFFLKKWQIALVLFIPLSLTLLASGLEKYPFSTRFLLFIVPFVYLLIAEGIERVGLFFFKVSSLVAFIWWFVSAIIILYIPTYLAINNFYYPNLREHIKPVMSYVSKNKKKKEILYIYYASGPAFKYYANKYGFKNNDYIVGISSRQKPINYINDINKLRKYKKIWFIFSHNCTWCIVNEEQFFLKYLNKIGVKIDEFKSSDASAYLYNINP